MECLIMNYHQRKSGISQIPRNMHPPAVGLEECFTCTLLVDQKIKQFEKAKAPTGDTPIETHAANIIRFPWKIHAMLDDAEKGDFEHTVSWCCGGQAFKVHDRKRFVDTILPRYFTQTRYKSFQRQCNTYGFSRVSRGSNKGLCHHKFFIRGNPSLCVKMQRTKIKAATLLGTDLILMSQETAVSDSSLARSSDESSQEDIVTDPFDKATFQGKSFFPVASLDDDIPTHESSDTLIGADKPAPKRADTNCRNDSFPWKIYDMLEHVEHSEQSHIVSWEHDGRALKIHDSNAFVQNILPDFFLHTKKLESFQRQLNLYGYTRVARGPQKGMYVHKYFVRGQRSLCRRISRPR